MVAGDAQPKEIEKEEMNLSRNVKISSCQTRYNEKEIERSSDGFIIEEQSTEKEEMKLEKFNADRCSVEPRCRKFEKCEMNHEDLDTAHRSVETLEGDP